MHRQGMFSLHLHTLCVNTCIPTHIQKRYGGDDQLSLLRVEWPLGCKVKTMRGIDCVITRSIPNLRPFQPKDHPNPPTAQVFAIWASRFAKAETKRTDKDNI
eukprot:4989818-Amphidinium_carterae.1